MSEHCFTKYLKCSTGATIKFFSYRKKKLISLVFPLLLLLPMASTAIQVTLQEGLNLRTDSSGILTKIGTLPRGSVVTIPDNYFPKNLNLHNETILNNWLGKNGDLKKFKHVDGQIKRDYFLPIKVVSTPNNTIAKGTEAEVAVRQLARKGDLNFIATENSDLHRAPATNNAISLTSLVLPPPPATCIANDKLISNSNTDAFIEDVNAILQKNRIEFKKEHVLKSNNNLCEVVNNYNQTCSPPPFEDFLQTLQSEAEKSNIPPNLVLALMTKESSGRCEAEKLEQNSSKSIGLFQLNDKYHTDKKTCFDKRNPNCITHPINNLKRGIKELASKYKRVNSFPPIKYPSGTNWNNLGNQSKDFWRKALLAYNGGEGYVDQARADLINFNGTHKTNFNNERWKDHKLFLFRMALEDNWNFWTSNNYKYKRSTELAISNLIFAETIAGEDGDENSLVKMWEQKPDCRKRI